MILDKIKQNKVIKAGIGYTVGNYLIKGINLLTIPLFARLMTVADYGIFNLYMSYEGICSLFIGLALHSSLKNAKYEFSENYNKFLSSISLIPILSLFVFLIVINCFHDFFNSLFDLNTLIINLLFIHSYCSSLLLLYNTHLAISYDYKPYLKIALFNTVLNLLLSIVLMYTVMLEYKYLGRILGYLIPNFCIAIFILYKIFKVAKPVANKEYWSYGLKYSLPIIPHGLSQMILSQFDRIMISKIEGVVYAGLYSFSFNINSMISILVTSLDSVFAPWYYENFNDKKYDKIKHMSSLYIYGIWCVICCVMFIIPEIILILGGKTYEMSKFVALPLLASAFYTFLYLLPSTTEYYYKKTGCIALSTMMAAILNIILNSIYIRKYGYVAGAWTTLLCYICYFIFHYIAAYRLIGFQQFNTALIVALSVLMFALMGFCYIFIESLIIRASILIVFFAVNAVIFYKSVKNVYK